MRLAERNVIQGTAYQVTPLPAGEGLRTMATLGKILGPAVSKAGKLEATAAAIAAAIGDLAERLDPAQLETVCRTLAAQTMVEAQPGSGNMVRLADVFDLHFSGNYPALFAWLRFALEVNYGPLADALRGLVGARGASPVAAA